MNDADGCPRPKAMEQVTLSLRVIRGLTRDEKLRALEGVKRAVCPCTELCDRWKTGLTKGG